MASRTIRFRSALRRRRSFPLLLLTTVALLPALTPAAGAQCPTEVWADEFSGSAVDTSKWSFLIGDGCSEGVCGWGNNELQSYQTANATVSNGTLKIEAREERIKNKNYTSARIRTLNQGEWTFGRFSARIKIPTGQGIWPAFWMLPTDEVFGGWPRSGEIDIMENIGSEPSTVHGTIHYGEAFPNNQSTGASYVLPGGERFTDAFHEFAIERQAGVIRWTVDGVLFSAKTTADTDPFNWPFDERFHFLLNVAVGGNWPGNPDGTTVFPQVMEVDWVRVHDGSFPHLAGDRKVDHQQRGVVYSVGNAFGGSSFSWSVPAGASIDSGQGTGSITVDWGTEGGDVTVDVTSACGNRQISMPVTVDPAYAYDFTLENVDDPETVTFQLSPGTLTEIANPDGSGVNPSATSGEYTRNAAEQFDVLVYGVSAIADAGAYVDGTDRFSMDVLTTAPPGTEILVQLEDSGVATPSNYPAGRHSRFHAFTGSQNDWERHAFELVDRPDPSTPDGAVDTLVILFATNSFSGDTFVWDNFDSYTSGDPGPGGDPITVHVASIAVGTQSAGQGNKRGTATVTLEDDQGSPVGSATVSGTFTGSFAESAMGVTAANGAVTLTTVGTRKGGVSFTFCVDDVSHGTLVYDPVSNVQTCASL
jgi:beta-glucanase (GH16 family)